MCVFFFWHPTLVRPAMKRLFCLQAKNGHGRFALSALPHYYQMRGPTSAWLIRMCASSHVLYHAPTSRFSLSGLPRAVPTKKKGMVLSSTLGPPAMLVVVTPLLGAYGTITILSRQPHLDQRSSFSLIPTTARRSSIRCWGSSAAPPQFHQAHTTM